MIIRTEKEKLYISLLDYVIRKKSKNLSIN